MMLSNQSSEHKLMAASKLLLFENRYKEGMAYGKYSRGALLLESAVKAKMAMVK